MKVATSILLVILLSLNLFGFYIAYYIKLDGVHEEMEQMLCSSPASLQIITLSVAEYKQLEWTTPGKECRVKGNMYDVAKIESATGGVRLYVRIDEDETELDNDFLQNFQSNQDLPSAPVKLLVSIIGQDFIIVKNKITIPAIFISTIFQSHTFTSALAEFVMEKISPPPGADIRPPLATLNGITRYFG